MPLPITYRRIMSGGTLYLPQAQEYFDQVVANGGVPLSEETKTKINNIFKELIRSGNISRVVRLHIAWIDNEIAARTSIINPSQPMCTVVGGMLFYPFSGWQVTANGDYINTEFTPSSDGGSVHTLNSAGLGCGISNNKDGVFVDFGGNDGTQKSYIFSALAGTGFSIVNNAIAGGDASYANTSNLDDNYYSIRDGAASLKAYKGATVVGTSASSPLGLPTVKMYLGGYNNNGVADLFKIGATYSWFGFFSGDWDVSSWNTSINDYKDQETLTAFGHSILRGNNGTVDLPLNFLTQFCAQRGYKQVNLAVSSTCLEYVSPQDPVSPPSMANNLAAIPTYNGKNRLVFMYLINDSGFNFTNYTIANFGSQAGTVYDYALNTAGYPAHKILWVDGAPVDPTKWSDYDAVGALHPGDGYVTPDDTRYRGMETELISQSSSRNIQYLSLQQPFIDNGGYAVLTADGRHYNQGGNNVAAATLIASSF